MEFYLVKNQKLQFLGDIQYNFNRKFVKRNTENEIIAELAPVVKNYATEALTKHLIEKLYKPKDNDKITWDLILEVEIPSVLPSDDDDDNKFLLSLATMTLNAYGETNFLHRIGKLVTNLNNISKLYLKFIATDFRPFRRNIGPTDESLTPIETTKWESKYEMVYFCEPDQDDKSINTSNLHLNSFCDHVWQHNLKENMITAWKNEEDFQVTFTILLVLPVDVINMLIIPEQPYFTRFRKMLDNKIETDMKLVADNGAVIKCHRAMIAASSEKLADLLKQEKAKRVNIMDHLTHGCIKALLDYIYCRDISWTNCDSKVTLQVLEAALQFEFNELVQVMQKVFLVRQNEWYGVDEAVDLFLLACTLGSTKDDSNGSENMSSASEDDSSILEDVSSDSEDYSCASEDDGVEMEKFDDDEDNNSNLETLEDTNRTSDTCEWEPLKKRAVEVLKWYSKTKYKDLMASSKYRQLFRETPQMAMEVGKLFLQLG